MRDRATVTWEGRKYYGFIFKEHSSGDSAAVKAGRAWASLDNETSFWFTKPSLLNLLWDVGFTSTFELLSPQGFGIYADRITLGAAIGERQRFSYVPGAGANSRSGLAGAFRASGLPGPARTASQANVATTSSASP